MDSPDRKPPIPRWTDCRSNVRQTGSGALHLPDQGPKHLLHLARRRPLYCIPDVTLADSVFAWANMRSEDRFCEMQRRECIRRQRSSIKVLAFNGGSLCLVQAAPKSRGLAACCERLIPVLALHISEDESCLLLITVPHTTQGRRGHIAPPTENYLLDCARTRPSREPTGVSRTAQPPRSASAPTV